MAGPQGSGIQDPYAPRKSSAADDGGAQPTEDEKKLAKQVDKLFEKAAKHRKRYDKDWVDNYKFYRGQQWLGKRPSYKHREVINMVFQTIQSQTSNILDVRPTISFIPREPGDMELSEILNQVFLSDWQRNSWMDEVAACLYDAHLYGVGNSYTGYDKNISGGRAGICYKARDPFDFYPDPLATDVNKNCEYFVDAESLDIDRVKKKYAGHKYVDLIKPDLQDLSRSQRQVETLHRQRNTNLDMPVERTSYSSSPEDEEKDKVLVLTVYLKPSDTEQIEKEDAHGDRIYITKLKYPRGRKVVKINNYIMEDDELPFDDLEFPFERLQNYVLPREYFGMSEVEQVKGPQIVFNKLVNFALDVLVLMGNPVWKVPTDSKVNTRKLINQPGLVIEYAGDRGPEREEGVQLQPYVFQLIDRMEKWFKDTAGDQDVMNGVNPTGVTANAAIENLLNQATKRVKQKMRNLDSYLASFGRHWVSRCFQYYTAPEIYRLTSNENANKYFKFHVEHQETGEVGPDGRPVIQKVARVRKYLDSPTGNQVPSETENVYEVRGDFDVQVNTVSGLAFSKTEREQSVFKLFEMGIIDDEEVLKRLDYPNYQQVLQRVEQKKAQMAEAEAAAAQPQGGQ
jgi:hypothetical protein